MFTGKLCLKGTTTSSLVQRFHFVQLSQPLKEHSSQAHEGEWQLLARAWAGSVGRRASAGSGDAQHFVIVRMGRELGTRLAVLEVLIYSLSCTSQNLFLIDGHLMRVEKDY